MSETETTTPNSISAPHNLELEAAVLGAILRHNDLFDKISEYLSKDCFYEPNHAKIYDAITQVLEQGHIATPASLRHFFAPDDSIIAQNYLNELALNVPSIINVVSYSQTLQDLYRKRRLAIIGQDMAGRAFAIDLNDYQSADTQIEIAEQELFNLAENGQADNRQLSLGKAAEIAVKAVESARKRAGKLVGITTGFTQIDEMMGGLHKSDLIVLAGRPAMGKTAFATNIAYNAARKFRIQTGDDGESTQEGGKVLFFSLEMSSEQLASRVLSQVGQVKGDKIRRNDLEDEEFQKYLDAWQNIRATPLFIDDTPGLSITALRQRARRAVRIHKGIDMIIIDYLQLLQGPANSRGDNRVQEISEITRGLKMIAKELNIPVIALSQLSRSVESREDKRPQLADLRESGSIEQDADVVGFLYRHEYYLREPIKKEGQSEDKYQGELERYNQDKQEWENRAQLIIAKQRHGPTSTIDLHFNKDFTHFTDFQRF